MTADAPQPVPKSRTQRGRSAPVDEPPRTLRYFRTPTRPPREPRAKGGGLRAESRMGPKLLQRVRFFRVGRGRIPRTRGGSTSAGAGVLPRVRDFRSGCGTCAAGAGRPLRKYPQVDILPHPVRENVPLQMAQKFRKRFILPRPLWK
jgi:hypothetical protein